MTDWEIVQPVRICIEFRHTGGLSMAELNVIQLLLKGYSISQIATLRRRSVKTISVQKKTAFKRLNVSNDASLLSVLLLRGIVLIYTNPEKAFRVEPVRNSV
ncbi:LuxR family transcriptional regulator [Salmonella enterica subsp. enterica serovar Saintpaul]|nr:LuxR family transcriptional regulator [Salmonella enterica]EBG3528092.1 LuxR family transcriptional regulator [Salmonella enterica subsp. enterica]EDE8386950.1 LuxR family transcriptional regulator [Salmonella enterica subsp. enterica serovar Shubra]EHW4469215.1 LuxR family transcriptional regulator [Salmonella enterica subsp. enterica serovar Kottbus]EIN6495766.1 LuxR family transcriptional regulator [Salmonella enterica subsp. enterica serovar Saintpaul]